MFIFGFFSFSGALLLLFMTACFLMQRISIIQYQNRNNSNSVFLEILHPTSVHSINGQKKYEDISSQLTTSETKPVACMVFNGRLGNLMFKYAFLHIISKSKNLYPILPENFELSRYFYLPEYESQEQNSRRQDCDKIKEREIERWSCSYDDKFTNLTEKKEVYFHGYFQSWKYWTKYEDEIREMFTFNAEIREEASDKLLHVLSEMGYADSSDDVVVGLHSRRGDYLWKAAKEFGYVTPNETYYLNAMAYFRNKFPNQRVFFIAASNDINWLHGKLGKEENIYFLENNQPVIDMAILSLCHHVIMSSGTFGWWAGWMSRGTVVYYKHLYTPGSSFSTTFRGGDIGDFIYPGWIGLA